MSQMRQAAAWPRQSSQCTAGQQTSLQSKFSCRVGRTGRRTICTSYNKVRGCYLHGHRTSRRELKGPRQ